MKQAIAPAVAEQAARRMRRAARLPIVGMVTFLPAAIAAQTGLKGPA
jgi:hypothetical protein